MTTIEKGMLVAAIAGGRGSLVRGYGTQSYRAGDEFTVTTRRGSIVNLRPLASGNVIRLHVSEVRPVARQIGEVPPGAITPEDPRIAWLFEDAERLARRMGLCADFDRITDALGVPGRERTFTVQVASAAGIEVTAKVTARSQHLAELRLRDTLTNRPTPALERS